MVIPEGVGCVYLVFDRLAALAKVRGHGADFAIMNKT